MISERSSLQCKKRWTSPNDQEIILRERLIAADFRKIKGYKFLFYKQRAKLKWAKESDKIKAEFGTFFKDLLGNSSPCDKINLEVMHQSNLISDEQCRQLARDITDREIWSSLQAIGSDKSLGLDGFSASFYKESWSLLGKELCAAVKHCFRFNALPKGVNAAYLALIPKSKLIDPAQGAFIKGRSRVGNVCVAQQLLSGYGRKGTKERLVWKIDLRKAYDLVNWDFLDDMLNALRFPAKFISWVSMCVTN
ncbi:hypothetical protein QQ045_027264 [Rhodiola kirilowii]